MYHCIFLLQGILVYMFRELMDYCVKAISTTGYYSLAVQHTATATYVILYFWSEKVLHRVCIGGAPRGMLLPRKIFNLVASFLSLFETVPTCVALTGFSDNLNECLITSLPGAKTASIVKTYGPTEFERSLVSPTVKIIERHDFRSILDYLLMKLRTALDRDWLQNLALLHRVVYTTFIVNFYMIFVETLPPFSVRPFFGIHS